MKKCHAYTSSDGFNSVYEDGTTVFGEESGCLAGPKYVVARDVSEDYVNVFAAATDLYEALKEKERLFVEMAQVIYKDEIATHIPHGLRERVQASMREGKADAAIARAEGRQA